MEYLVTMTTHVPDGTSQEAVDDTRTREAAHSRQLAAQGYLLRLWRPPLQPGEWRTLGLFAANDGVQLEKVLASMPLHVWRSDEVTPLSPHPNDPGPRRPSQATTRAQDSPVEFLTTFTVTVPPGTPPPIVDRTSGREAERARALAEQGQLLRLWALPDQSRSLGLWRAEDAAQMQTILKSLPLDPWTTVETTPLSEHPSDPALTSN